MASEALTELQTEEAPGGSMGPEVRTRPLPATRPCRPALPPPASRHAAAARQPRQPGRPCGRR
jgi:hypothetical protein